jgi:hypothetical protein
MGFMDKAKQMADQAQQKIEDAQKQFNESQSQKGPDQGGGVRYDKHGRPIQEPPAAQTAPAPASPADVGTPPPAEQAAPEPAAQEPAVETPQPKPEVSDGVNAAPDPFKPIQ